MLPSNRAALVALNENKAKCRRDISATRQALYIRRMLSAEQFLKTFLCKHTMVYRLVPVFRVWNYVVSVDALVRM